MENSISYQVKNKKKIKCSFSIDNAKYRVKWKTHSFHCYFAPFSLNIQRKFTKKKKNAIPLPLIRRMIVYMFVMYVCAYIATDHTVSKRLDILVAAFEIFKPNPRTPLSLSLFFAFFFTISALLNRFNLLKTTTFRFAHCLLCVCMCCVCIVEQGNCVEKKERNFCHIVHSFWHFTHAFQFRRKKNCFFYFRFSIKLKVTFTMRFKLNTFCVWIFKLNYCSVVRVCKERKIKSALFGVLSHH